MAMNHNQNPGRHLTLVHLTKLEEQDNLLDSYDSVYPGVKQYNEVIRRSRKAAQEVLELERIYALPSNPSRPSHPSRPPARNRRKV